MSPVLSYVRLILIVGLLLFGIGSAHADKFAWEGPPLIVVHSDNTPPLSFKGVNGAPKGFVIDFWNAWSVKTGIPITFVQTDWPGTLRMIREGKADIHGGLYFSDERDVFLDYTSPYFSQRATLFVRASLNIEDMSQLGDRAVAVLEQGYSEYWLRTKYPDLRRKPYVTSREMVQAALDGEVDALLTEYTTLIYQLGSTGYRDAFVPLATLYERSLHGAVAENNDNLLGILEEGIQAMSPEGREKIFSRWIVSEESLPAWVWPSVGIGMCALIIGVIAMSLAGRRRYR